MADVTAPVAPASAATPKKAGKVVKKRASGVKKAKAPANHPVYLSMVSKAIQGLKEHKGSSRQAILKYIMANFSVGGDAKMINSRIKQALKRGVKGGQLKQAKGAGAAGSFRMGEKKIGEGKKKAAKPKKAKAKKASTGAAKPAGAPKAKKVRKTKPKSPKKPKAKAASKPKKAKSPKKPKALKPRKPAAAKKPKKAKSPKKSKAAKKPAAATA